MDNAVVNINKEYIEKEIRKMLAIFCDDIISKNKDIENLRKRLENTDKRRCELARAYAKNLSILLTKKQYIKSSIPRNTKDVAYP